MSVINVCSAEVVHYVIETNMGHIKYCCLKRCMVNDYVIIKYHKSMH